PAIPITGLRYFFATRYTTSRQFFDPMRFVRGGSRPSADSRLLLLDERVIEPQRFTIRNEDAEKRCN
ncbi:hypothetical protein Q6249_29770, partial [Klebsiella pneumoniae]|nr:hypothetical protein [Klebsiella pneumoniae]